MEYVLQFKPKSIKDLRDIPQRDGERILLRCEELCHDLQGDIKRLTNFTPEYRLRVGDWRVLFEIEEQTIIVYRIVHRREAY